MTWTIEPLPIGGPRFEAAIEAYGRAFAEPPYLDPDRGFDIRARMLDVHLLREGFRAFCALDPAGTVLGMTYGYHSCAGQWWHDTVARALSKPLAAAWLSNAYEVVEVAVSPESQSRGIGSGLVNTLLAGLPERTAVLSTRTDSRAHELYERLGFEVIKTMVFTPRGALFHVMGAHLHR